MKITNNILNIVHLLGANLDIRINYFYPIEPSWEELRLRLMATPEEENRLCMTVYPNSISKTFNVNETGPPLMLTSYIKEGYYQEAVDAAKVNAIFQTVVRLVKSYINYYFPR